MNATSNSRVKGISSDYDPFSEVKSQLAIYGFEFTLINWKNFLPVAFTIGADIDIVIGSGGEMSPAQITLLFQGPQSGSVFNTSDASKIFQAGGWDLAGSFEGVLWFFTGNIDKLYVQTFQGGRFEMEAGVSYGLDINGGFIRGEYDKIGGGRLIGIKGSIGGGYCPWVISGHANNGYTNVHKILFELW